MRLRFQKLLANLNNLAQAMGTGTFLSAAKADDLKKKYPEQAKGIDYLADEDPTPTKKYLDWSVKMLLTGADYLELAEAVSKYNTLLPRLEGKDRDINSFSSLRDLKDAIEKAEKKSTKGDLRKKAKKGGVILYEDDRWMLVHPTTINGSIYYGSNTSWCVSRRDEEENYFYTYVAGDNIQFYFIIDKQAEQYDEELAQQIGGDKQHFSKVAMLFLNGQPYRREPFQDATNRRPSEAQVAENIGKETFDKLYAIAKEHAGRNKTTWAWELLNAVDNEASFNKLYKNNEDEIQYLDMDRYQELLDSALRCQASEFLVKAVKDAMNMHSREGDALITRIVSKGPDEVLFELSNSNFQDIKEKIAVNPKASERTLLSILKDEHGYDTGDWRERLAAAVARNPNVFKYKKVVEALLNFKKDLLSFKKPDGYLYTAQEAKELSQEEKDQQNKELTYEIVQHLMSNEGCDNDTFKHGLDTIIAITGDEGSAIADLEDISVGDVISKQNLSTIMDYLENGKLKVTDPTGDYTSLCGILIFREDISSQEDAPSDLINRLYAYLKNPAMEAAARGNVMPEGDNAFGDVHGPENASYAINQVISSALTRENVPVTLLRDVVNNAEKLGVSERTILEIQDELELHGALGAEEPEMNTEERLSAAVEALHAIKASPSVLLAMEEAAELLSAAKADDLTKKYPEQENGIRWLADQDPTPQKKYLDWSVKMLLTGADYLELAKTVKQYDSLLPRLQGSDRDVNSFKSLRDMKDAIEKAEKKSTKGDLRKKAKKGGVILYEDDRWMLVHPVTMDGSIYYGSNTSWCVSRRDKKENHFYTYVAKNVQFYFLIDKQAEQYDEEVSSRGGHHFSKVAMLFSEGTPYASELFQDAANRRPSEGEVRSAVGDELFDKVYSIAERHANSNPSTWISSIDSATDKKEFSSTFEEHYSEILHALPIVLKAAKRVGALELVAPLLKGADLTGAKLRGADLIDANLEGAILRGAKLRGADLTFAKLIDADLTDANLFGADLFVADLTGANLTNAILESAVLVDADLIDANLEGTNLEGANLRGANLTGIKYNNQTIWPAGFTPPNQNDGTAARLDASIDKLHAIKASPSVLLAMEEAAELLSAANVGGLDRNHATTVMIPLPKHLAARFPGVEHNNGHEPHLTVCFLSADKDMTAGKASEALAIIRKVCRRQAPFRVALDVNTGLHDFGPSEMGSKALWFNVRQDPNDVLDKLHRAIKNALKLEGIPVDSRHSYQPHVTWRYVSNDQSEGDRQRMSAFAASRFNDLTTVWFDVKHLILSMPDGSQKAIALSPRLR